MAVARPEPPARRPGPALLDLPRSSHAELPLAGSSDLIDFREITAGFSARWEVKPGLTVNATAGWMIDRRFEFDERKLLLNGDGAPLLHLSVIGTF